MILCGQSRSFLTLENDSSLTTQQNQTGKPLQKIITPLELPFTNPYSPYKIVLHMAHSCLVPFIKTSHQLIKSNPHALISETSCIQNLTALSVIFSVLAKAKEISARLNYVCIIPFHVFITQNSIWSYQIDNLFAGKVLIEYSKHWHEVTNEDKNEDRVTKIANLYMKKITQYFFHHTQPIMAEYGNVEEKQSKITLTTKYFKKLIQNFFYDMLLPVSECDNIESAKQFKISLIKNRFKKLSYCFNKDILSSLKLNLISNDKKTNDKSSFIYYINIYNPKFSKANENEDYSIYHTFIIEQFHHEEQSYYRIYSAWAGSHTLLEDFQRRGYGETSEGCLNLIQIKEFLKKFRSLVCQLSEESNISEIREELFGYRSSQRPPILFFDEENNTFKGLSLRYEICQIDPHQCIENYNQLISSDTFKHVINS